MTNRIARSPVMKKPDLGHRLKAVEEFRMKDGDFVDHLPEPKQASRKAAMSDGE
ncbi:hypothetical protein N9496_03040 [Akkermansiaceae bacterium]|nr:hypothetical protein [Akkermansiaceae bacterium]|tara:strand:+ start:260 stop:421 length:162 start_codon:yes stop_codon:yes gene_type:complete